MNFYQKRNKGCQCSTSYHCTSGCSHYIYISVVDHESKGAYGMWFTDTTNKMSKGLKVINTAVSRAKKRLILVGHHGFWTAQEDQLLGELFRNAECIVLNQSRRAVKPHF